jgi:hypothetical protein
VQTFSAAVYGAAQHRLGLIAERVDVARPSAALVHPEIGVLGSDDQLLQTCSQVGLILSAMRLSRSWEEGLWHAS